MDEEFLSPEDFFPFDGRIFFSATTENGGRELWVSDGTDAGTYKVKDINPGVEDGLLYEKNGEGKSASFCIFGSQLYFTATDGIHGFELWTTDGSPEGTHLVSDINVGEDGSFPTSLFSDGNSLYFSAYQPDTGFELWKSDGTENGTYLYESIVPGPIGSSPSNIKMVGSTLIYKAYSPGFGDQLWKEGSMTTATEGLLGEDNTTLFPNPVADFLYTTDDIRWENIEIINMSGQKVKTTNGGTTRIDVSRLPAGVYFLKALSRGNLIVKRFVKL